MSVPGRDRRARALDITEKGKEALGTWERECRRVDDIMTAGFTKDEVAQLKDMLERLRGNLAEAMEAEATHHE